MAQGGQCLAVTEQGCVGNEVMDENGQCTSYLACYESGGVPYQGECREQCPGGRPQLGSMCLDECPDGFFQEDGHCLTYCEPDQVGSDYYFGACAACPSGEVLQGFGVCDEECPAGEAYSDGKCAPACIFNEVLIDGACVPTSEIDYDDFVSICEDFLEEEGAPPAPEEFAGATPEETCGNYVDDLCDGSAEARGAPVCQQRPCGEGQENLDGQCVAACTDGAERNANGLCPGECPAGQLADADGLCQSCAEGLEFINGQCAATCLNGAERDATGRCPTSCPEGQVISATGVACIDRCIYINAPIAYDGRCIAACPEGQMMYQGQCQQRASCPDGTLQRTGNTNNVCLDECPEGQLEVNTTEGRQCRNQCSARAEEVNGVCVADQGTQDDAIERCLNGDYLSLSSRDEASCEAALAAHCAENAGAGHSGVVPPECMVPDQPPADGAPPADEAPPTEDQASPPADEVTPPPPADEAPLPDGTAPPTDGSAPPPPTEQAPPPPDEMPPLPPSGPVTGKPPEATPAKGAKPSLEDVAKESAIPLKRPPAKPVAVVLGIGDYDNDGIPDRPQAIDNAAHIVRFLKTDIGMEGDRIITGRNATLSDFADIFGKPGVGNGELQDVLKKTKAPEMTVYYAGRAKALDGGKDVLLLPADADPTKPETGIKLSALYDTLAAMGIAKLRMYLDPSFVAGDGVVKIDTAPRIGPFGILTPRDWVALSAASDDAALPDDQDRSRSRFTESLVTGLRGVADTTGEGDGDGTVSAKELHEFTRDQAAAAAKHGAKVPMPSLYGKPGETLRTY